jgi:hypothetical protein
VADRRAPARRPDREPQASILKASQGGFAARSVPTPPVSRAATRLDVA